MSGEPPPGKMSREEALRWVDSGWWEVLDYKKIALAQMRQDRLCMPFGKFHEAVEKAAGVPVWTHELVDRERIIRMIETGCGREEDPVSSLLRIKGELA